MGNSSLPYNFKTAFSDTTVISVDASGNMQTNGRIQVGTSAGDMSDVLLCRTVNVSGNNTKRQTILPQGSNIVDVKYFQQTPIAASAGGQADLLIGVTAQDARFVRFTNLSAQGYYTVPTSTRTSAWNSVSGASCVLQISVTAMSGAIASAASGRVQIFYTKPQ